jgi:hypothetical protein
VSEERPDLNFETELASLKEDLEAAVEAVTATMKVLTGTLDRALLVVDQWIASGQSTKARDD